jgi:hypothetical protein
MAVAQSPVEARERSTAEQRWAESTLPVQPAWSAGWIDFVKLKAAGGGLLCRLQPGKKRRVMSRAVGPRRLN